MDRQKVVVVIFYGIHKKFSDFLITFEDILQMVFSNYDETFCMGDFDVNMLDVTSY